MHTEQAKKSPKANIRNRLVAGDTALGEVTDPVKMYLREMGGVTLLSREGENEIGRKIEAGEREVLHALLESTIGVDYLINLGVEIEKGKIRLKHVIRNIDEGDDHVEEMTQTEQFLATIRTIKDLNKKNVVKNFSHPARTNLNDEDSGKLSSAVPIK